MKKHKLKDERKDRQDTELHIGDFVRGHCLFTWIGVISYFTEENLCVVKVLYTKRGSKQRKIRFRTVSGIWLIKIDPNEYILG